MQKFICLSCLLCGLLFAGLTASAQEVAKKPCTPEARAACAKVCTKAEAVAAVPSCKAGKTEAVTQSVAANEEPAVAQEVSAISCDPSNCPPLCKLLCPLICPQGMHSAQTAVASCETTKPVVSAGYHASALVVKEQ